MRANWGLPHISELMRLKTCKMISGRRGRKDDKVSNHYTRVLSAGIGENHQEVIDLAWLPKKRIERIVWMSGGFLVESLQTGNIDKIVTLGH
jgi:hypothetical protein